MLGRWEGSGGEGRGGEREGGGVTEETGKAETQEKGRQISSLGIITLNIKGTQKTVSFVLVPILRAASALSKFDAVSPDQ